MDLLERYRNLRLDLGDATRSLLYLARARQNEAIEAACRRLLKRLADDRFAVAIVGQHSRGKTTLMNALLGAEFLPTGILPMTSVITVIRYGSEPRALYYRRGSDLAMPTTFEEVPRLVARESSTRAQLEVVRVELEVPAELLRLGLTFVDTPGVGSTDLSGALAARDFLPDADAVLLVTAVDSALTTPELELLAAVPPSAPVFCVVNKVDLVSTDQTNAVVGFVERTLLESARRESPEVFALSALQGLRHRLGGGELTAMPASLSAAAIPDGGMDAFQARLEATLTSVRAPVALATALDVARGILTDERRMLDLGERAAHLSEAEAIVLRTTMSAAAERAETERARVVAAMREDSQHTLDVALTAHRQEWHDLMVDAWAHADDAGAPVDLDSAGSTVGAAPTPGTPAWWSAITASLSEASAAAVLRRADELGPTLDAALSSALDTVQLDGDAVSTPWASQELPGFGAFSIVRDAAERPDDHGVQTRSRKRRDRQADRVLGLFGDHLHEQNDRRAEWIARDAARRTNDSRARLERYLQAPPSEFERDAIARIAARLDAVGDNLTDRSRRRRTAGPAHRPTPSLHEAARPTPARPAPFDCVVCAHERTALIEDLRHRQFFVATRDRDQAEFAHIGGLCAQHTWTYASLASPVGIASAYAPLVSRAAETLDAAPTASSLLDAATEFGGNPEACPVCRVVADAERDALWALDAADSHATACMRHLEAAAAVGLRPEALRCLARRLAENLHRHAEDMRAYALKREALAVSSLTVEESDAYREALLMIAGDPLLARPAPLDGDAEM